MSQARTRKRLSSIMSGNVRLAVSGRSAEQRSENHPTRARPHPDYEIRTLLPDGVFYRPLCPLARHSLPGAGICRELGVCYILGITSIDPETNDLLFERFVSQERYEPPDIDVDFEHELREEVIQWIYNTYAHQKSPAQMGCELSISSINLLTPDTRAIRGLYEGSR